MSATVTSGDVHEVTSLLQFSGAGSGRGCVSGSDSGSGAGSGVDSGVGSGSVTVPESVSVQAEKTDMNISDKTTRQPAQQKPVSSIMMENPYKREEVSNEQVKCDPMVTTECYPAR
jgi:hypothetical protein